MANFVAGFGFVPFVAVCGISGDGHKIRHKSTFGDFSDSHSENDYFVSRISLIHCSPRITRTSWPWREEREAGRHGAQDHNRKGNIARDYWVQVGAGLLGTGGAGVLDGLGRGTDGLGWGTDGMGYCIRMGLGYWILDTGMVVLEIGMVWSGMVGLVGTVLVVG